MLTGVTQLIRDVRQVGAGAIEPVEVALTERQDHVARRQPTAGPKLDGECAFGAFDGEDLVGRPRPHVRARGLRPIGPCLENGLAWPLLELERMILMEREVRRFGHDELPLLVPDDHLREFTTLEHDVRNTLARGLGTRCEACRAPADDQYLERFRLACGSHVSPGRGGLQPRAAVAARRSFPPSSPRSSLNPRAARAAMAR